MWTDWLFFLHLPVGLDGTLIEQQSYVDVSEKSWNVWKPVGGSNDFAVVLLPCDLHTATSKSVMILVTCVLLWSWFWDPSQLVQVGQTVYRQYAAYDKQKEHEALFHPLSAVLSLCRTIQRRSRSVKWSSRAVTMHALYSWHWIQGLFNFDMTSGDVQPIAGAVCGVSCQSVLLHGNQQVKLQRHR